MPPLVTAAATILCSHGGHVQLAPGQQTVLIQGSPVLCEPDLVGAPIVGCAQPTTSTTKQCTAVVSTLPGSASLVASAGARPAYLASLRGFTDSVPPGTISVLDPGQKVLQA
jgi:hypothetical protein